MISPMWHATLALRAQWHAKAAFYSVMNCRVFMYTVVINECCFGFGTVKCWYVRGQSAASASGQANSIRVIHCHLERGLGAGRTTGGVLSPRALAPAPRGHDGQEGCRVGVEGGRGDATNHSGADAVDIPSRSGKNRAALRLDSVAAERSGPET